MKIGCIGWGSLIWYPRNLLIEKQWNADGPILPVEFLRQSKDGRLTLVISAKVTPVPTLWTKMTTSDLNEAIESLRDREECISSKPIGVIFKEQDMPENLVKRIIYKWLQMKELDAVIWTNLGPKFQEEQHAAPTKTQAIAYLANLRGEQRAKAEEYIRKAPACVATEFRAVFESEFGWTALLP